MAAEVWGTRWSMGSCRLLQLARAVRAVQREWMVATRELAATDVLDRLRVSLRSLSRRDHDVVDEKWQQEEDENRREAPSR